MPSFRTFAGASTILVPTHRPSRGLRTRSLNWPWSCDTDPSGSVHPALTSANPTVPRAGLHTGVDPRETSSPEASLTGKGHPHRSGPACWGPKRRRESCRAPMVLMDESAENVAAADLRPGYRLGTRSGVGRLKIEAAMRSDPVVVLGVRTEDALQVASTEDEDVVETLSSNGADPSLRERVRARRTDACLHH